MEKLQPKEFALKAIAPYYKDSSICGIDNRGCVYLTNGGKKCVLGAHLLDPEKYKYEQGSALTILGDTTNRDGVDQNGILVPEAVGILTSCQWMRLQIIHDNIADRSIEYDIARACNNLELFTLEELKEYCSTY